MDALLDSIRVAMRDGASDQERAAGVSACNTILSSLEPQPPSPAATIAAVTSALKNVPTDQLLDLAIAKLRAALPPDAQVAPVRHIQFQLIPLPQRSTT